MKRKNNRFVIYRVMEDEEGRRIKGRAYLDVMREKLEISIKHYRRIYLGELQGNESMKELLETIHRVTDHTLVSPVGTSDVVSVDHKGELICYYIDGNKMIPIKNFIKMESGEGLIDDNSKGVRIKDRSGKWDTVDSIILSGRVYFLLEHQKFRGRTGNVVVDTDGKVVLDEIFQGFDDAVKEKIIKIMTSPGPAKAPKPETPGGDEKTERDHLQSSKTPQKSEAQKSEIQKNEAQKNDPSHRGKPSQKNETKKDGEPRKRVSVIMRLRMKQIEIAEKSGKPVPSYLQKELERYRK